MNVILLSTYNGGIYLRKQLDSVLSQTIDSFEVIVVDDNGIGTEDGEKTAEVMKKYEGDDTNNSSIVILAQFGATSFMFTGDAEDVSEKEMLMETLKAKSQLLVRGYVKLVASVSPCFL